MYKFLDLEFRKQIEEGDLVSPSKIYNIQKNVNYKRLILISGLLVLLGGFLPWTQNIRSKGYITTLDQSDRQQEVNTIIPGKIERWYVKEGDFVKKGDPILQLGEVKVEYFDPILLERTRLQILAKNQSKEAYILKAGTAEKQMGAILEGKTLKLASLDNKIAQLKLKISADSSEVLALNNALEAYQRQYEVAQNLEKSGALSVVELEKRRVVLQDAKAKKIGYENKILQGKQEILNLKIEKNAVVQDYLDKTAKTDGERLSSVSNASSTDADIYKLENQLANYDARQELFVIKAPQDGQITKVLKAGIGEIVKEGENIVLIVPAAKHKAVELFIEPMDLPLVKLGQKISFVFDGFPAIVFSGWPKGSYGTFTGQIKAIETSVSSNGKFRILVDEDPKAQPWPKDLRLGGGANGIILLKDVSVYYELWRNINGFPPEYYVSSETKSDKK